LRCGKLRDIFKPFLKANITVFGIIHDRKSGMEPGGRGYTQSPGAGDIGAMADAAWQLTRIEPKSDDFKLENSKLRDRAKGTTKDYLIEIVDTDDGGIKVTAGTGKTDLMVRIGARPAAGR